MDASRSDRTGLAAQDWPVPTPAKTAVTNADGESEEDARCEGSWMGEHLPQGGGGAAALTTNSGLTYLPYFQSTTGIRHTNQPQLPDYLRPSLAFPYRTQRQGLPGQSPGQSPDAKHQSPDTNMPPNDHYQSLPCDIGLQRSLRRIESLQDHGLPGQSPDVKHQNPVTTMPPNDHYQSLPYHIGLQRSLRNIQPIPASTIQIKHQVITHQPAHLPASTIQINYQMCAYRQEFTNQLCCHYKRRQHMVQQQHGHYYDLKPTSPRSGDDWPD